MTRKIPRVEIEVSANIVPAGNQVMLRANLSDLELEGMRAQNERIEYVVGDTRITSDINDPRSALWTTEGPEGERHVTLAMYSEKEKRRLTIGEASIYVIEPKDFHDLAVQVPGDAQEGDLIDVAVVNGPPKPWLTKAKLHYQWFAAKGSVVPTASNTGEWDTFDEARWDTTCLNAGPHSVTVRLVDQRGRELESPNGPMEATGSVRIVPSPPGRGDVLRVALQRPAAVRTHDQAFWSLVRSATARIGAKQYADFIDAVFCPDDASFVGRRPPAVNRLARDARDLQTFTYGVSAYELLKTATQVFLLLEAGGCHAEIKELDLEDEAARLGEAVTLTELRERLSCYLWSGHLPYIDRVLRNAFRGEKEIYGLHCYGVLGSRVQVPALIELIWSYWHEQGMLVQSINAIARRFQNVRAPGYRDPLAHLEIDPLRPLSNLLWGYIQDQQSQNLLTAKRRALECCHQYGLPQDRAVPWLRPADSRSKFLEAFNHLLHRAFVFYKEDNETTVIADGFALLNALQEVHLLLAEGAHNQFGDLPWTARAEMLIQQWLLSRPEMRDFLQGRRMVPYKEPWMAQVDTMKSLQGWTDIPVTYFRDLGVYGEQILLTIRYGDWIDINNEESAKNWARYWRPEIQGYLHAYRAVTGMDLTNLDMIGRTMPASHLQRRLAMQRGQ